METSRATTPPTWTADLLAGLSVAGVLLPEAVAYAAIAGVAPAHALVAALVGLCVYALLGTSRLAIVAPTSAAAGVFGSAVLSSGPAMGYALVLATGALLLLAGWLKAGFLGAFVSRPVLRGFAWGLAVTIVIKQLPHMLALHVHAAHAPQLLWLVARELAQAHGPSVVCAVAVFAAWVALNHTQNWHRLPTSLVVLALSVLAVYTGVGHWSGVQMVGSISLDLAWPSVPSLGREPWLRALEIAPALLLIVFAESWGAMRSLALQSGDKIDANRELLALGACNLASGLVQGLPVGAGFSAASASQAAGARSKWAGVAAAVALALLLWWARPALALLPVPALAAVVTGILSHKLWPRSVIAGFRSGPDAWLAVVAALGVLALGILPGMLLAVGLSLALAIRRFAQPLVAQLRQLSGTTDYVDLRSHPQAVPVPLTLVLRPEEPLFFANAEGVYEAIEAQAIAAQQANPDTRNLILSLEVCDDLDSTALEATVEFAARMRQRGWRVLLARIKDRPREALAAALVKGDAGAALEMFWSVADAVRAVNHAA